MSFKREGNDGDLLKNLSHQRVRELLSSHIPQDEAKLLSNGRLTCTICNRRPIFDTINILSQHRQGKKHLKELSAFIKCKEELKNCPPVDGHKESLYLNNFPKKSALKNARKPILEMPKIQKPTSPVMQSQNNSEGRSTSACVRNYLKTMSRKSSLDKVVDKNRENYGVDLYKGNECNRVNIQNCISTSTLKKKPRMDIQSQDYETKLRMSGWIKDLSGNWIKDPNVEFDSDEDEAPPPPT